tara:strand:+ start:517 stop:837 length:321 start_codon:yes stop_codon:yes gene_type:complete
MAYVRIENGIVVQKQPNKQEGFIKATESVVCGQILVDGEFVNPIIEVSEDEANRNEITKLESMITRRAEREASKRDDGKLIGYINGDIYCDDINAEIERLEGLLGR